MEEETSSTGVQQGVEPEVKTEGAVSVEPASSGGVAEVETVPPEKQTAQPVKMLEPWQGVPCTRRKEHFRTNTFRV